MPITKREANTEILKSALLAAFQQVISAVVPPATQLMRPQSGDFLEPDSSSDEKPLPTLPPPTTSGGCHADIRQGVEQRPQTGVRIGVGPEKLEEIADQRALDQRRGSYRSDSGPAPAATTQRRQTGAQQRAQG